MRLAVVVAGCILAVTAHADPWEDARAALVPYRGIYRIRTLTGNATSCDVEGPSVLGKQTEQMFVIGDGLLFCSTISECRTAAAADHAPQKTATMDALVQLYAYRFNEIVGPALIGHVDETWWLDARTCGAKVSTVSLVPDGAGVRFERRSAHFEHAPNGRGMCGTWPAHELGAHKPCDERYVMRGVRIAPL
jgi:hypothetical protein